MTPHQAKLFEFILSFIQEHGYSPNHYEMKSALGMRSQNSIVQQLEALRGQGKVTWVKHMARTVEPTEDAIRLHAMIKDSTRGKKL